MNDSASHQVQDELRAQLARLWRYGLVLSASRETAEDLVQATCVRALKQAGQFQTGTPLNHWLLAILRSIWLDELRAPRVRTGRGFVDADLLPPAPGEVAEATVLARQVLAEVQALPEAQREMVLLIYVEGLSYREAAELLDIPVGIVTSRLAAARGALGKVMQQDVQETADGEKQP